jgi:hypothetical protein
MSKLRFAIAVGITVRGRRGTTDNIEIVWKKFRLAKRGRVVAPREVILELREGERILFSDPVMYTRVP